jgi:hypothetical protein
MGSTSVMHINFLPPAAITVLAATGLRAWLRLTSGMPVSNQQHGHKQNCVAGASQPVPRFGQHWGAVGFQGDDPATDLRGVGMLGLLQLLYLPHHSAAAAQKLYQLSTR